MSHLKSFILSEELRAKHAVKYFNYFEHYHGDMVSEVKDLLERAWRESIKKLDHIEPNEHKAAELLLKSDNAVIGTVLDHAEVKLHHTKFHTPVTSNLSVKVSASYDSTHRLKIINELLESAAVAFNKLIEDNPAIFAIPVGDDKLKNLFTVVRLDDTVKLQFKTSHNEQGKKEFVAKTIFMVAVEYGKLTSKTRHYDRVFFIDYAAR